MEQIQYAIITRKDEIEEYIYGHKFQTGLNICPHSDFFHIYDVNTIPKRLPIYINDTYIRFVSFPPNAQFKYPHPANPYFTIKADKIILSERIPLSEFITADMVKQKHINLQHIPKEHRTYEMYIAAIRQSGIWIKEIPEQTDEACLLAVQSDSDALVYIKNITPQLIQEAYKTAQQSVYLNTLSCPWKYIHNYLTLNHPIPLSNAQIHM